MSKIRADYPTFDMINCPRCDHEQQVITDLHEPMSMGEYYPIGCDQCKKSFDFDVQYVVKPLTDECGLLNDWNQLDIEHKKFVLRVRAGRGCKHSAEPHHCDSEEKNEYGFEQIALWKKAEASGFIARVGSYKWVTTDKFADLERKVFGI